MATVSSPEYTTRHRNVEAAVWENEGKRNRTFFNVSITKSWKDDNEWKKSSASFGSGDLLPAAKLLDWADSTIGQAVLKNAKAESEKKPLASKKRGLLEVAVWHKTTEDGDIYYCSLKRSYKDGDEWKNVLVWLGADEVLPAGRLLTRCFDEIDQLYAAKSSAFVQTARDTFNANDPEDDIPF